MTEQEYNLRMVEINTDLAILINQSELEIEEVKASSQREIDEIRRLRNEKILDISVKTRAKKIKLHRQLLQLTQNQIQLSHE